MNAELHSIFQAYLDVVQTIYGIYLDSTSGFDHCLKFFSQKEPEILDAIRRDNPINANVAFLEKQLMMYAEGFPEDSHFFPLHKATFGDFKSRNSMNGLNYKFAGNLAIVAGAKGSAI